MYDYQSRSLQCYHYFQCVDIQAKCIRLYDSLYRQKTRKCLELIKGYLEKKLPEWVWIIEVAEVQLDFFDKYYRKFQNLNKVLWVHFCLNIHVVTPNDGHAADSDSLYVHIHETCQTNLSKASIHIVYDSLLLCPCVPSFKHHLLFFAHIWHTIGIFVSQNSFLAT